MFIINLKHFFVSQKPKLLAEYKTCVKKSRFDFFYTLVMYEDKMLDLYKSAEFLHVK